MKNYDDKSEMAYYWLEENICRVLLVVLFAGLGLWGLLLEGRDDLSLGQRLVRGMGPELAGIVIAAVTIDALAERRQEAERKRILIRQLGSKYRDVTEIAIIELREREWLYDGSLRGAFLQRADLSAADLCKADLRGVDLSDADLNGADLWGAKLNEATLTKAKLFHSTLVRANFHNANLSGAKLIQAFLDEIELDGANIEEADLSEVRFWRIIDIVKTRRNGLAIMPDGVRLGGLAINWNEPSPDADYLYDSYPVEGPSIDKWKAKYLATHGGTETDLRDPQ